VTSLKFAIAPLVSTAILAASASAAIVQVQVNVENLAASNGVALSPLTVAFHGGTFDAFDSGAIAQTGTRNIAESGNGTAFLSSFAAAQPDGVSGVITATTLPFGPGIYLPGGSGSRIFTLDTSNNKFFSYGCMVVPSNDRFLGNDSATAVRIFDDNGNFVAPTLTLRGRNIWDAGSEVDAPFGAAFLAGQNGGAHVDQNGLISFSSDFSPYANLLTAAGYNFTDLPSADGGIARISFSIVPSPSVASIGGIALAAAGLRRRR
jgi:hypothetical protein